MLRNGLADQFSLGISADARLVVIALISLGAVIALLGSPVFIWLLYRQKSSA